MIGDNVDVVTIVVSGPQATGKTTLALAVGSMLGAPVFSRDPLMAVLSTGRARWPRQRRDWVPQTGFSLQTVLLARQLELGQSAVLECVATPVVRRQWREMTLRAGHRFVSVECICTDVATHRARFDQRQHGPLRRGFTWNYVVATMRRYEPDERADVVADAIRPVASLAAEIVAVVRQDDSHRGQP
jgi:predicted kinase